MSNSSNIAFTTPPQWSQEAIWYQIFVERFYNAHSDNDPTFQNMQGAWPHTYDENWELTPWTSDWYKDAPKSQDQEEIRKWYDQVQSRRYGGDLQGVIDKLDYIQSLGVNAIYLNPINDAPSLHKYDARNFHHVDIHFGPDPEGDKLIIAQEDPNNPDTWQWTSADQLFLELIAQVHERDIRIIVDYSFNHTGIQFWAWQDILIHGIHSKYADWYDINMFNHPNSPMGQLDFNSWAGVKELPQLRKKYYSNHIKGFPYQGDLNKSVKKHVFKVVERWLAPKGYDAKYGIDGFRLDVADEIGLDFWRDFRKHVKAINPEAFLVGEVWWENWPHKMMDPKPYISDDVFDAIMYYQPYKHVRAFFAKPNEYIDGQQLKEELGAMVAGIPDANIKAMMMMSASHDTPRLLSSFNNKNIYKYLAKPLEDVNYKTGKPSEEVYERVKNFLVFQFTMPGSPQIWAGDEMGMWGADDPDCRKPLWWPEYTFDPETQNPFNEDENIYEAVGFNQELHLFYKKIIDLRKHHPVFTHGELKFIYTKGDVIIYKRRSSEESIYIIFNNSDTEIYLEHLNLEGYDLWNEKMLSVEDCRNLKPIDFKLIKVKDNITFKTNEYES